MITSTPNESMVADRPISQSSRLPRLAQRKTALGSSTSNLRTVSSLSDLRSTPPKSSTPGHTADHSSSLGVSDKGFGATSTRSPVGVTRSNLSLTRASPSARQGSSIRAGNPGVGIRTTASPSTPSSLRKVVSTATLRRVDPPGRDERNERADSPRTPTRTQPTTVLRSPIVCSTPERTKRTPVALSKSTSTTTSESANVNAGTPRSTLRAQIAAKRREMQSQRMGSSESDLNGDQWASPVTKGGSMMDQQGLEEMFKEMDLAAGQSRSSGSGRRAERKLDSPRPTSSTQDQDPDCEDLFGRSLTETLVKASRSGKLNVANMGLERFPRELWTGVLGLSEEEIGAEPEPEMKLQSEWQKPNRDVFSSDGKDGFGADDLPPHVLLKQARSETKKRLDEVPFYEREDMTIIRASGNMLKIVDTHIGMFGALKTLDLRSNLLSELPRNIVDLRELEVLDLSHNHFRLLPKSIILLPSLVTLDMSHNSLVELDFSAPEHPDQAVLDFRKDHAFLTSFPGTPTRSKFVAEDTDVILPSLKQMMLQGNKLTNVGLPETWPENLEMVDLSGNALTGRWDVTSLAACRRLKKVVIARNGIRSLTQDTQRNGWDSLECIDLSHNEIEDEDQVRAVFGSRSGFNLMLEDHPLSGAASSTGNLARSVARSPSQYSSNDSESPSPTERRGIRALRHLYDPIHREIAVDKLNGRDLLGPEREFDLQLCADALPDGCTMRRIAMIDLLPLRSLRFPVDDTRLAQVKELSIVNSSIESTDDFFACLAEAMPDLEALDLSGSRLTHINGIERLLENGLKKLNLKGARISDIEAITDVARQVRAGTWTGRLLLEELDLRDNVIPKLSNELGWLPLRTFLVENNDFRIPSRRHWEKGTPALLQWLKDGL